MIKNLIEKEMKKSILFEKGRIKEFFESLKWNSHYHIYTLFFIAFFLIYYNQQCLK